MVSGPISRIRFSNAGPKLEKQAAREALVKERLLSGKLEHFRLRQQTPQYRESLSNLKHLSLSKIDRKVKHLHDLSFIEAFCGMCYVLAATNSHFAQEHEIDFQMAHGTFIDEDKLTSRGTAYLQLMAAKESFRGLTPEEVAGMAAASMLDTVISLELPEILETSGMGGDTGFTGNGIDTKKTINISTLSALVLASLGVPTGKHGSYSNTSAVGSTEAIEELGARTAMHSVEEVLAIWNEIGFCYFDAHWCKTIHDLSHLITVETINHVIGPMSPPISPETLIHKVMGVNEKVHPSIIAQAYAILHNRKHQKVGGVAVVTGLADGPEIDPTDIAAVKGRVILDELSPFSSVVAFAQGGEYFGSFILRPSDFGISFDADQVIVNNDRHSIMAANLAALSGQHDELTKYLAMNAALAHFVARQLGRPNSMTIVGPNREYLQESFVLCYDAIQSRSVLEFRNRYVIKSVRKIA